MLSTILSPFKLIPGFRPLFSGLPVWLVVSGAPDVSNSFVSPYSNYLSPSLAGGVQLS